MILFVLGESSLIAVIAIFGLIWRSRSYLQVLTLIWRMSWRTPVHPDPISSPEHQHCQLRNTCSNIRQISSPIKSKQDLWRFSSSFYRVRAKEKNVKGRYAIKQLYEKPVSEFVIFTIELAWNDHKKIYWQENFYQLNYCKTQWIIIIIYSQHIYRVHVALHLWKIKETILETITRYN